MDRVLRERLKKFANEQNVSLSGCNAGDIAQVFQETFPEYRRMNRKQFRRRIDGHIAFLTNQEAIDQELKERSDNSKSANDTLTSLYKRKAGNALPEETPVPQKVLKVEQPLSAKVKKQYQFMAKPETFTPSLSFCNLGGLNPIIKKLCQFALQFFHSSKVTNLEPASGLLITGPSGCGKSLLAECFCGEFELKMLKVSCPELVSSLSGDSENRIREMFDFCKESSPCVLFLDDIESILQKRDLTGKQMEVRIISQFVHCIDALTADFRNSSVLIIGTTSSADSIDPVLRRAGRFDTEISIGMPNVDERVEIMKTLCQGVPLKDGFDWESVSLLTPGFVGADLKALIREASLVAFYRDFKVSHESIEGSKFGPEYAMIKQMRTTQAVENCSGDEKFSISEDDFRQAVSKIQPSSKREGFITVPSVTWSDVGALHSVRKELQLAIIYPVKHRHLFQAFCLSSPPGILLTGPPGCGKTMLAKAVANEAGINFISVKGPELLNMYLGESERAVRQVFSRAKNSAPCVIFFDEIDALCPKRKDTDHGSRVVQQFLTELDGVESREGVYILAATNRPDVIDSALLRPGRFDKVLAVPVPTVEDRADILCALTKNGTKPQLSSDCDLTFIAQHAKCEKFSGADLAALVREASVIALQEVLNLIETKNEEIASDAKMDTQYEKDQLVSKCVVSKHHFEKAFFQVKSSVAKSDYMKCQNFR